MERDAKPGRPAVVAYVPNLLDRSKVAAAGGVRFVATAGDLPAAVADAAGASGSGVVVVIDLNRPGVLEVLPALAGVRTVGFSRHTDTARMAAAAEAGCTVVLPRSSFFTAGLPALD